MLIHNNYKPVMVNKKSNIKNTDRTLFILLIFLLAFGVLNFRHISLITGGYYVNLEERAEKMVTVKNTLYGNRGGIYDDKGKALALSQDMYHIAFSPKYSKSIDEEKIAKLASIIKKDKSYLMSIFENKKLSYFQIKDHLISLKDKDEIEKLAIPHLSFERKSHRTYFTPSLSPVLGYTNNNGEGLDGLELINNKLLINQNGYQLKLKDGKNNVVSIETEEKPIHGTDIHTTISSHIQMISDNAVKNAYYKTKAKNVSAVVIDGKTGEIKAMSSYPYYDSNKYQKYKEEQRKNFPVSNLFEPGSIIKPLVMAYALEKGAINKNSHFSSDSFRIANKTISDHHDIKWMNLKNVIQKSSNVGMSKIVDKVNNQNLFDFYKSIGIGKKNNYGLSGEQFAYLKKPEKWSALDKAVMSFGYGFQSNMLTIASAYTIFTNNGKYIKPRILATQQKEEMQIISPETAKYMSDIMVSVTEKGGTGQLAKIDDVSVAGKTGTSKKLVNKSYNSGKYTASFYGFAPAENPQYIVAVTVDEPVNGTYGGTSAAPVFKEIMEQILH